jgi:hypothetical protein
MSDAMAKLEGLAEQTATSTFECSLAQLWLAFAVSEIRLNNIDLAAAHLARARELGWLDLPWLHNDPELRPLHDHAVYRAFVEELASAPDCEIPMPRFASESSPQLASGNS